MGTGRTPQYHQPPHAPKAHSGVSGVRPEAPGETMAVTCPSASPLGFPGSETEHHTGVAARGLEPFLGNLPPNWPRASGGGESPLGIRFCHRALWGAA